MNRKKSFDLLAVVLLATAFVYTLLRALLISIFHDEAVTFLYLASLPYSSIMDYSQQVFAPNNHLLNTVLIKVFTQAFGISEFVIRLPALLGHLLYLTAVYKICRMITERWMMVAGIVLMVYNPFVLELFSAARGYAFGLGLFTMALFYLLRRVETTEPKKIRQYYIVSSTLLAFAIMANFIFLQVYISFLLVVFIYEIAAQGTDFRQKRYPSIKMLLARLSPFLYSFALIMIFCLSPMLVIRERIASEPYLGGVSGLWSDTVMSLVQDSLYGQYKNIQSIQAVIGVLIFMVTLVSLGIIGKVIAVEGKKNLKNYLIAAAGWLFATLGYMFFQWRVLGVKYVIGRHAVFFVPLFMTIVLIVWVLSQNFRPIFRRSIQATFGLLVALMLVHFVRSVNFDQYSICPYAASTKQMMQDIVSLNQGRHKGQPKVKLASHWLFSPMIDFYIIKDKLTWLRLLPYRPFVQGNEDYFYLFSTDSPYAKGDEDIEDDIQQSRNLGLKVVKEYKKTATYLAIQNK